MPDQLDVEDFAAEAELELDLLLRVVPDDN